MVAAILAVKPDVDGLHVVLRATARTSLVLFLLAFTASALWKLLPGAWSRWQISNRRYLGLSFATSHTLHLLAIVATAWAQPHKFFRDTSTSTLVMGGIAYAFLFVLAATSFDRSAAWVGARNWKVLHTVGSHYIWLIFVLTDAPAVTSGLNYLLGTLGLALALLLRVIAAFAKRRDSIAQAQAGV
jgi:hypothetical protein